VDAPAGRGHSILSVRSRFVSRRHLVSSARYLYELEESLRTLRSISPVENQPAALAGTCARSLLTRTTTVNPARDARHPSSLPRTDSVSLSDGAFGLFRRPSAGSWPGGPLVLSDRDGEAKEGASEGSIKSSAVTPTAGPRPRAAGRWTVRIRLTIEPPRLARPQTLSKPTRETLAGTHGGL